MAARRRPRRRAGSAARCPRRAAATSACARAAAPCSSGAAHLLRGDGFIAHRPAPRSAHEAQVLGHLVLDVLDLLRAEGVEAPHGLEVVGHRQRLSTGRVKCSPASGVYSHRVTKFDSTALRATSMLSAVWKAPAGGAGRIHAGRRSPARRRRGLVELRRGPPCSAVEAVATYPQRWFTMISGRFWRLASCRGLCPIGVVEVQAP